MSFTTEEVWDLLPAASKSQSVHLAVFPKPEQIFGEQFGSTDRVRADWTALLGLREAALKSLEEARQAKLIGSSLEAQVHIAASNGVYEVAQRYREYLRELLIVSAVELEPNPSSNGASPILVKTTKAPGQKCERCWTYSTHVGEDGAFPTVCERCSRALSEMGVGKEG
jgi:isoleucyl-tRNA synthetase